MPSSRLALGATLLAFAFGAAACESDDAIERDAKDASEEVQREAGEAGKDVEKALPGDADDDGR